MNILFHAHSGIRYLVLLIGLIAIAILAYALITRKPVRAVGAVSAAFTGVVDLQVLLGLILLFLWPFYGALIGHITLMVLAAATAHGASVWARRSSDARRALTIRLGGILLTLLLVVLGILAIGRSIV